MWAALSALRQCTSNAVTVGVCTMQFTASRMCFFLSEVRRAGAQQPRFRFKLHVLLYVRRMSLSFRCCDLTPAPSRFSPEWPGLLRHIDAVCRSRDDLLCRSGRAPQTVADDQRSDCRTNFPLATMVLALPHLALASSAWRRFFSRCGTRVWRRVRRALTRLVYALR